MSVPHLEGHRWLEIGLSPLNSFVQLLRFTLETLSSILLLPTIRWFVGFVRHEGCALTSNTVLYHSGVEVLMLCCRKSIIFT